MFLSHVGGPSFTAVEQGTENACLVDVLFDTFREMFSQALLVNLDMPAGVFADSSGDSESRPEFMEMVEPR